MTPVLKPFIELQIMIEIKIIFIPMGSDLFAKGHCFIFLPYFFCRFFPAFKTSRDLASKGSWAQTIHCI